MSASNVARAWGHSRSTQVDRVYAHSLQSGMGSVVERVTAKALGEQPKFRLIESNLQDVGQPSDETAKQSSGARATA